MLFTSLQFSLCMSCQGSPNAWQSMKKDLGSFPSLAFYYASHGYFHTKNSFHGYLIFMAWALAILRQALQGLVDQCYILLIDVEPQQAQATCCAPTDAIQKLKGLAHKVVICFVVLIPQKVLSAKENMSEGLKNILVLSF